MDHFLYTPSPAGGVTRCSLCLDTALTFQMHRTLGKSPEFPKCSTACAHGPPEWPDHKDECATAHKKSRK
ncbi:hypothetical protein NDU88_001806 [Pleurodeles waltl]|uniref:Uncharacterized protein n=1 Tax=Pleurodeles waltl TaxID=8319 RepID=A0AAV7PDK1_PLEWA|nr:hypothetical protein NDU88_001806 [Pleurodeles waltl]